MKKVQSLGVRLTRTEQKKIIGGVQETTCSSCVCKDGNTATLQQEGDNPETGADFCSSFCGPVGVAMISPVQPC